MSDDSTIKLGDEWPYHYRGTRYHYNNNQEVWWQTFNDGLRIQVKSGHELIIKELMKLKTEGGSFRITETGDVIAKIEKDNLWNTIFICEMDEPFKMEEIIDLTPAKIQPGDLWPGFYDGARYSYCRDKVWWNNSGGPRQYVQQTLPKDIMMQLSMFKPAGGSFRITENGYVITLIPKQPLPNDLKKQWESLSDVQRRMIATKVEHTIMLPVYIGRYHEGITLNEPQDFSKPLTDAERKKMLDFLDGFSFSAEIEGMVPKNIDDENLGIEPKDDPEE